MCLTLCYFLQAYPSGSQLLLQGQAGLVTQLTSLHDDLIPQMTRAVTSASHPSQATASLVSPLTLCLAFGLTRLCTQACSETEQAYAGGGPDSAESWWHWACEKAIACCLPPVAESDNIKQKTEVQSTAAGYGLDKGGSGATEVLNNEHLQSNHFNTQEAALDVIQSGVVAFSCHTFASHVKHAC